MRDFPRVGARSGNGVGKTFSDAEIALWFLYCFQPSKVITTAPTWRQVEKILWSEIRTLCRKAKVPLGGEPLLTELKLDTDWFALGLSSDRPENMEGYHSPHLLYIVDEAKGVRDDLFEPIEGALANARFGRLLVTSIPGSPVGYFYDIFGPKFHLWSPPYGKTFHIPCTESPLVSKQWIEARKAEWGEDSPLYQARVLGNFPIEAEDTLIALTWIELALQREISPPEEAELQIGIDVARYGDDETVLTLRKATKVLRQEAFQGKSLMRTCGEAVRLKKESGAKIIALDDSGLGGGVTDRLRELGHEVVPVNFGARANDPEKFVNLGSELYWKLRELFRVEEGKPDEESIDLPEGAEKLMSQLSSRKYEIKSDGRIMIEPKQKMKKRGHKSPDRADSLAIAFAKVVPDREPRVWVY